MFATGDSSGIWTALFILCIVAGVWKFYMATFRTDDYERIMKLEREQNARIADNLRKTAQGGFTIFRMFRKK